MDANVRHAMNETIGADAPIGVFDSGIGGLTILRKMRQALPNEHFIYFGDLGRAPYGTKSMETVVRYASQITRFLLSRNVKLVVIACNTASAVAGDAVARLASPVPVIEVVEHGAAAALDALPATVWASGRGRVGIVATETTVASNVYRDRLLAMAASRGWPAPAIKQTACQLFVALVETGFWTGEIPRLAAEHYLAEMRAFAPDVLILGCTHFPPLRQAMADVLPPATRLVDSAPNVARRARRMLEERDALHPGESPGTMTFYTSDSPESFRRHAERFLDVPIDIVHHVDVEAYEAKEGLCDRQNRH